MNNFRLWKCTIQTVNGYLAWQACMHTLCIIDLYTGSEDIGKGHGKLWLWSISKHVQDSEYLLDYFFRYHVTWYSHQYTVHSRNQHKQDSRWTADLHHQNSQRSLHPNKLRQDLCSASQVSSVWVDHSCCFKLLSCYLSNQLIHIIRLVI